MSERRYKSGINRDQIDLFPARLEDYISESSPVRAIEAYVESLDVSALGYAHTEEGVQPGQPAYAPQSLLKLYLYGYMNRVRSSRALERECSRNIEVMWLLQGLRPTYKTIASFRGHNAQALRTTHRDFILLCRELDLYGARRVSVDGSFFKGNVSAKSFRTSKRLKKQIKALEEEIGGWLRGLDEADEGSGQDWSSADDADLEEKLEALRARKADKAQQLQELESKDKTQESRTDPDARLLRKGAVQVQGYNVQLVTDDQHHLVVADKVTTDPNDLQQLYPMARQAQGVLGTKQLEALGDGGYYNPAQLHQCIKDGITPYVPVPKDKADKGTGRYTRDQFIYDGERDAYRCPAGRWLVRSGQPSQAGQRYLSRKAECNRCAQRQQCLSAHSDRREIWRSPYAELLVGHRARMAAHPEIMRRRSASVEHPFGTLKRRAGWDHFLVRGLDKVQGEWSLMALSYNFTRVLNIVGMDKFRAYCAQRAVQPQQTLIADSAAQQRRASSGAVRLVEGVVIAVKRCRAAISRRWRHSRRVGPSSALFAAG